MPLSAFSPQTQEWFGRAFAEPTAVQEQAWPAIATGEHTLISAPTGSGKTLAAFLYSLDRLATTPREDGSGIRVVYVSPLKALSYDVERNLQAPLIGIGADIKVAIRTGDTSQKERMAIRRTPPDVLITTPESLYLMLTSQARDVLRDVEAIIVDEIHAVASTKRGAHLALTLERLSALVAAEHGGRDPQRIGLSATQNPLEEVGRFMVGPQRTCRIVDAGVRKPLDLKIQVPVESMVEPEQSAAALDPLEPTPGGSEATRKSIWPAMYPQLLELVREHRSTIIFVNNRRGAERLALRLNELAAKQDEEAERPVVEIARAHHGSLAREERLVVEEQLKAGQLPCLVATSSLELGIDMGAVDLVLQVESPKSVSRGLQRIGRAGHNVGDTSKGRIFPKFRADLLECAVVVKLMREGKIEPTVVPRNPLDVLCQQIVAIAAGVESDGEAPVLVDDLYGLVTKTYTYAELSRELLENVLDMLDGRYPSQEFGELRPRIVWDRVAGTIRPRKGARQLAVTNAGTIPDRGLYAVVLPDGRRVGELDEEMVYEARPGPDVPARRVVVAHRGDPARPRRRLARPGRAGRRAVLEGRQRRAPQGAGPRDRRLQPLGRRPDAGAAGGRVRPRPARRPQPRGLPGRAAGGHARHPERPHDRRRALPRRDRRLAAVRAVAVRRARARRVGAGAEREDPRRGRPGVRRDLVRRRDHRPPPRRR